MTDHTTAERRAARVLERMAEHEADVLLVTDLVNVRWLTGFTGSSGLAVIGEQIRRFVTDFRYLSQAGEQVDDSYEQIIHPMVLDRALDDLEPPVKVGYDHESLTVAQLRKLEDLAPDGLELVPAGGLIEELRAIKDPEELDRIRAAAALADRALLDVLSRGLAGRTEREVGLDLEFTMRRMGAEAVSFPPIIAAGAHGALPHAEPRDIGIPRGVLVTIDWGAQLDGYASDCTRTFATGEVDPRDRAVYEVVLKAQEAALAAIRPGPLGKEVDAIAREIIEAAGHGEHFGHGLGHGVGLAVHEGPRLSKQGETALAPGMVVTVEPGVYVPGAVGVRIEDLVAVTEDGHEVLNGLPKHFQVVD